MANAGKGNLWIEGDSDFGDLLAHHTFDASPNAARPPGMPQIGGKIERPFSDLRQANN